MTDRGIRGRVIVVASRTLEKDLLRFQSIFSSFFAFQRNKTTNTSTRTLAIVIYVRRLPFRRLSRCIATIVIRQNKRVSLYGRMYVADNRVPNNRV